MTETFVLSVKTVVGH